MSDEQTLPENGDSDVTQPARQGEVPDWFTTSAESSPVIIPAPRDQSADVLPLPPDEGAPALPVGDSDEDDDKSVPEAPLQPAIARVGTRRRRPTTVNNMSGVVPGSRRRVVAPVPVEPLPPQRGYGCADVITAIFLLLTVLSASITVLLLANPDSPLNPFPNPTYPSILVLASPIPTESQTPSLTPIPPTLTPAVTATRTPTITPTNTPTPTITNTPVFAGATQPPSAVTVATAAPQFTLSPFPFTIKPIQYTANKTSDGCQWQSIAGSVVDMAGKPVKGLAIRVTGSGGSIDEVHYSGTEQRFGEGGFEVFLGAIPRVEKYSIQLLGRTGTPISDTINLETRSGCEQNVVLVNFVQNHTY